MCGICGFIETDILNNETRQNIIKHMIDALVHRGPDDSGYWLDDTSGITLGHRRLSIIDLSPLGHQPMLSVSERYVLVYNGEIYNFQKLRRCLQAEGCYFSGQSDTEVILASIEKWGLEKSVQKFVGMFAFALWDRREKLLHLVRDRIGEKPLYYGWIGETFLFGSELKALRSHLKFNTDIDRNVLALYLRYNYVPAPYSIYKNIFKLIPGTIITICPDRPGYLPEPKPYWSAIKAVEYGERNRFSGTDKEATAVLDGLLKDSIKGQMIADVPLGAFLSGGIDSSTVVALMQAQSSRQVKTFSIGFTESDYDEAKYAKAVAAHLGTDHTELYVTPNEAVDVIPRIPQIYDEPFADSSQIPTFLVASIARRHVTVSLSGDGGDELFGGYNRYFWGRSIWKKIGWMPIPLRNLISGTITLLSPGTWDNIFNVASPILPKLLRQRQPGDKIHKLANILNSKTPDGMYQKLVSLWDYSTNVVFDSSEHIHDAFLGKTSSSLNDFTEHMMYLDLISYLPDDILVKVDRACMGVSLESRVPFLDHRIVEYAWRLPLHMKIRNGQGKWLLRQVLYQYVPQELIERPKMGFGIPIDSWLRGPLKEWASSLLDRKRLEHEGYFNPEPICNVWQEHLSGSKNLQYHLWGVLMFQAWLDSLK